MFAHKGPDRTNLFCSLSVFSGMHEEETHLKDERIMSSCDPEAGGSFQLSFDFGANHSSIKEKSCFIHLFISSQRVRVHKLQESHRFLSLSVCFVSESFKRSQVTKPSTYSIKQSEARDCRVTGCWAATKTRKVFCFKSTIFVPTCWSFCALLGLIPGLRQRRNA